MNKISFIIEFDEISKTQEGQLSEFLTKTGIKFQVLESDNDLKKYKKQKEVIDRAIEYINKMFETGFYNDDYYLGKLKKILSYKEVEQMNKEDYNKYYIQGSDHYLIPKDVFKELFNEMINWKEESKGLNQKYLNAVADYETTMSELQKLKKENKILIENSEHNDKVVDKVNWENQELKKQLIGQLQQENKQLKSNWNMLKEHLKNRYDNGTESISYRQVFMEIREAMQVLEIAQELEKGDSND